MLKPLFITATGTEIGKTYITAGLIRAGRAGGADIRALKPIVTGFDPAVPAGADPVILADALGLTADAETLARISPWQFKAPLSPDIAAAREGQKIDFSAVSATCRAASDAAAKSGATILIEGIGGVMVPIDPAHTVRDLIAETGLPALLVTGSYLGAISHTLTAIEAMSAREIPLAGIIVNETPGSTVATEDMIRSLQDRLQALPIAGLAQGADPGDLIPALGLSFS